MAKGKFAFDTRSEAVHVAQRTLKKMKGKGWRYKVHENMGWFFTVYRGDLSIGYHFGKYSSLLSTRPNGGGGETFWTDRYHHTDPNKVVAHQLRIAREFMKKCQRAIDRAAGKKV